MRKGHKENLEALGGFVFNLEWNENKMTKMRVLSKEGGVCRVRSYGAIGSPLMRKAKGRCPNAAIASTEGQAVPDGTPESCFERAKNPLPSVCLEFDTEPGEILEFQGQSGNQDWTDYAAHLDERFLKTAEAARIAQNVIDWQLDSGVWPKNVPMHAKWLGREAARARRAELRKKAKTTEWLGGKGSGGVPNVLPDRDTWENAENWSNGAPQFEDTVVFAKDATIWTMSSAPYECARLVLRGTHTTRRRGSTATDGTNRSR